MFSLNVLKLGYRKLNKDKPVGRSDPKPPPGDRTSTKDNIT